MTTEPEGLVNRKSSIPQATGPWESRIPEPRKKVKSGKHTVFTHVRRTEVVKYAEGPKLQMLLAENALITTHHTPTNFGD